MENFPYISSSLPHIKLEGVKIEVKTDNHQSEEIEQFIKTETDVKFETYEQKENEVVNNEDDVKFEEIELESCDLKELEESEDIEETKENKILAPNTSQSKWKCYLCSSEYNTKDDIREHIASTHKDPSNSNLFMCNFCHYTTRYLYKLKCHEAHHKRLADVLSALPHQPSIVIIKQETGEEPNPEAEEQKCGLCDFKSKNLADHITTTHKNSSNMFKCQVCDYVTPYFHALKYHVSSHSSSSNEEWYHCYKCNHRSKQKDQLKEHMLKHHARMLGVHSCDKCWFQTASSDLLLRHLRLHIDQPYECKSCDYRTKYKGHLKTHILKHNGEVFQCSLCEFHTNWKISLIKHVARHVKNAEILT